MITSSLKNPIKLRQNALKSGNAVEFNQLRNLVNRERKDYRAKYYEEKVKHLKDCKPSDWWKKVKKLSGMKSASSPGDAVYESLEIVDGTTENVTTNLANIINVSFLSPMKDFVPQSNDFLTHNNINGGAEPALAVATEDVFVKLANLNPYKANGPDGIPCWLLKENADILADPVRKILSCSNSECHFPQTWKEAGIVLLPKQNPVRDINKHLRPISLTSIGSKIVEDLVIEDFVKPAVLKKIDKNQFASIPKSSTTHALISMLHKLNSQTDENGSTVRVLLFDLKKVLIQLIMLF